MLWIFEHVKVRKGLEDIGDIMGVLTCIYERTDTSTNNTHVHVHK